MHSHHDHGAMPTRAGARYQRRLWLTFLLVVSFFVVEVVAGFLTGSLALLSDAGHMLADAVGLGMALAAIHVATRVDRAGRHTFGLYRLEILAALANAVLLFGVAVYVLIEAIHRFQAPITVLSGPMLAVALLGLGVNLVGVVLLRQGASESLNVEGAFLEVLADLLGSVGVVIAAVILLLTGWPYADSLFAATIGLFILPRAWHLGRRAGHILLQAAPADLDLKALQSRLTVIPGVAAVHDLHVWTLTSGMEVGSVHLRVRQGADAQAVLASAQDILRDHGVGHVTVQVESTTHDGKACQWEG
jgi:cobalt-zinc-cadmium efflux system protein